jgi:hypothetical protein
MGKVYAELDEKLRKFISRQPVFFVATAPCLTPDREGGARGLPCREQRGQHPRPAREHERRSFATRRSGTISTLNGLRARNVSLPLTSAATV